MERESCDGSPPVHQPHQLASRQEVRMARAERLFMRRGKRVLYRRLSESPVGTRGGQL